VEENWKKDTDFIAIDELRDSLRKLEYRKCTGPDGINAHLLKYGRENLNCKILNCINAC
jgi:hypothetical protein